MQQQDAIEAVWKVIDADSDYVVNLTREMVKIPSVNPKFYVDDEQNRETEVQSYLQAELESLGLLVNNGMFSPLGKFNRLAQRL